MLGAVWPLAHDRGSSLDVGEVDLTSQTRGRVKTGIVFCHSWRYRQQTSWGELRRKFASNPCPAKILMSASLTICGRLALALASCLSSSCWWIMPNQYKPLRKSTLYGVCPGQLSPYYNSHTVYLTAPEEIVRPWVEYYWDLGLNDILIADHVKDHYDTARFSMRFILYLR